MSVGILVFDGNGLGNETDCWEEWRERESAGASHLSSTIWILRTTWRCSLLLNNIKQLE